MNLFYLDINLVKELVKDGKLSNVGSVKLDSYTRLSTLEALRVFKTPQDAAELILLSIYTKEEWIRIYSEILYLYKKNNLLAAQLAVPVLTLVGTPILRNHMQELTEKLFTHYEQIGVNSTESNLMRLCFTDLASFYEWEKKVAASIEKDKQPQAVY